MLTSALYLSAIWFILSFIPLIFFGEYVKTSNLLITIIWFILVVTLGSLFIPGLIVFKIVVFLIGIIWFTFLPNWNFLAKVTWITMFFVSLIYLIYSFGITAFATANIVGFTLALIFFFVEVSAFILSLTYAFEALDTICRTRWNRKVTHLKTLTYEPTVSLHVPTYNEPPDIVIKTLESLSRLKYENYEVLLIDNNTPDEAKWRILEKACDRLGSRFRFIHLDKWPGFKSGALNFALAAMTKDSEIVGVIDSDYEVDPNFLRDIVPEFEKGNVAFVQTPQDYRGSAINSFFQSAYYGYKYFFNVSMPSRNERNAIIFAGTMGLIRKSVLAQIGGWDEWCITEDAEASLRILKLGYESVYINKSYGRGLMPLTFDGFKKQRFRWCFGGIQILKKHWESLMPWANWMDHENKLTLAQKYYYLVGGLQWYNDLLNLFFAFFLILGGILSLMPQIQGFRPFTIPLLIIPAVFLITGLWRFLWVLRNALNLSLKSALNAMVNFFSLGWAVTLGSIQGLIQKQGVFLRTPKVKSKLKFLNAISATQSELLIGLICLIAALMFVILRHNILIFALGTMLVWEGGLFMSAPIYSLISTSEYIPTEGIIAGEQGISENYAARWIIVAMAGIGLAFLILKLIPQPKQPAPYSRFQPKEVSIPGVVIPRSSSPNPTSTPSPTSSKNPNSSASTSASLSTTPSTNSTVTPTQRETLSSTPTPSKKPNTSVSPNPSSTLTPSTHPKSSQSPTLTPTPKTNK